MLEYTSASAGPEPLEEAVGWRGPERAAGRAGVPNTVVWLRPRNGAERIRTANFQLAKLALYQLSYRPGGGV
jgi:hypothetical protein